jgi:hypothetical protein
MLVDLSISIWYARRKDKRTSAETTSRKHAENDAGAWWTYLVSRTDLKEVIAAGLAGRLLHYKLTLPWSDDGPRILPSALFLEYTTKMRKAQNRFDHEVSRLVTEFPEIRARSRKRLGELYDSEMMPGVHEIEGKFGWNVVVYPMPSSADFRIDIGNDQLKEVSGKLDEMVNSRMASATTNLWQRLYEPMSKIAERLGDPEATFRDSLITNLIGICDLLPQLNIMGDEQLDSMRQEIIKKITSRKPGELRTNDKERAKTAKSANDILNKMQAFLGKVKP